MTQMVEERFFDSNGVPIHYIVTGSGVTGSGAAVVLLHGLTRSVKIPWEQYGFFSGPFDDYQLIAMDCRGHGKSGKPHSPRHTDSIWWTMSFACSTSCRLNGRI
jgi:pimeloyl-ACP methyl ester carboxylesterase